MIHAGAGYTTNERIEVRLMSNIGFTRHVTGGADSTITELATTEALREVNSQTLRLIGVGDRIAPYLGIKNRALPDTDGVQTQSDLNEWIVKALNQLDNKKVQHQNCTNQLEGEGPHMFPSGIPEYTVLVNTTAGTINPGFIGLTGKVLKGGEILFFNAQEEWEINSGSGGGGGDFDNDDEIDPRIPTKCSCWIL